MSSKLTSVRLPDGLYRKIIQMARDENRSRSNMIIVLLEDGIEARKKGEKGNE